MTEQRTFEELAGRVEALTGPDREIDAEIWLAVTPGATRKATTVKSSKGLWPDYTIDETREASGALIVVPAYTASLDAAMTLYAEIPELVVSCPRRTAAHALRARSQGARHE